MSFPFFNLDMVNFGAPYGTTDFHQSHNPMRAKRAANKRQRKARRVQRLFRK